MITPQPELRTARFRLRPFRGADAADVVRLAGDPAVARQTLDIPHPYRIRDAEVWIASQPGQLARGEAVTFAVIHDAEDHLVGAVTLVFTDARAAELGYWIGRPYWGLGYATEAARAVVDWGFGVLGLRRVHAAHFPRNPASGAVLRKLGMHHEGRIRRHVVKEGVPMDVECYGLAAPVASTSVW